MEKSNLSLHANVYESILELVPGKSSEAIMNVTHLPHKRKFEHGITSCGSLCGCCNPKYACVQGQLKEEQGKSRCLLSRLSAVEAQYQAAMSTANFDDLT